MIGADILSPSPGRERAFTFKQARFAILSRSVAVQEARASDGDANAQRKETMKQMDTDERSRLEFLVGCGRTVPQVARELGRNPSTIRNELLKHRIDSDKRYGCSNRLCARFAECTRKEIGRAHV